MILRHVIKHFRDQEWTAIFLDFLIVVVGVFVGLQVQNWNQELQARSTEKIILRTLRGALVEDEAKLEKNLERYSRIEKRAERLLVHMRASGPYSPDLDTDFGSLYGVNRPQFNLAAYNSLKSQGLELISDEPLRSQILQIYEQTYPALERIYVVEDGIVMDLLRPYFLKHFKNLAFNKSATPLDYSSLLEDVEFLNMVDYRRQVAKQGELPTVTSGIANITGLIAALDRALDDETMEPKP